MRRGRGKGKKQNATTAREDRGSDEEEKIPAYKRRGRPQKPVKDETEGGEEEILEKDDGSVTSKEEVTENGRKRKKAVESKESNATEEEENDGLGSKSSTEDSVKSSLSMGFRQVGSRRKNKPRRAAEAVVECHGF